MPFSSQKEFKVTFLNSIPLSLLSCLTGNLYRTSAFLMKSIITPAASLLALRKKTHVYLEYSSTITRVYLLPAILGVLTGPNKSMCNKSRGDSIVAKSLDLNVALCCFPFSQARHNLSFSYLIIGRPDTSSFFESLLISLKFILDKRLCHNHFNSS